MKRLFWIGIILLAGIFIYEFILPESLKEGFESGLVPASSSSLWANFAPRRGDIGPGDEDEGGHIKDPRYFQGYEDVQRLGVPHDYCRVISEYNGDPTGKEDKFLACALAGTDGLSSTAFRTEKESQGMRFSRDDYMRDVNGDGRSDYCRILKTGTREWEVLCRESKDTEFSKTDIIDPEPPLKIRELLSFYKGCLWWFRFADDMLDYCDELSISRGNDIKIDETPKRLLDDGVRVEGLKFDGTQFLRIGEKKSLEFGEDIRMRSMRAFCLWVYVDEFTNNAHFFDFGNGAGKDNVWLGISKPSEDASAIEYMPKCESTIPEWPAGPQAPIEQTPQEYMETSEANLDEFECIGNDKENTFEKAKRHQKQYKKADLIYEVWDKTQRAMRIKINNVIPQDRWVHIAMTAKDTKSFRPDLDFYIDGRLMRSKESGFLPQTDYMKKNYIGKSNWSDATSQYADKDELFKGSIFDFRAYVEPIKVDPIYKWGKRFLDCKENKDTESK